MPDSPDWWVVNQGVIILLLPLLRILLHFHYNRRWRLENSLRRCTTPCLLVGHPLLISTLFWPNSEYADLYLTFPENKTIVKALLHLTKGVKILSNAWCRFRNYFKSKRSESNIYFEFMMISCITWIYVDDIKLKSERRETEMRILTAACCWHPAGKWSYVSFIIAGTNLNVWQDPCQNLRNKE